MKYGKKIMAEEKRWVVTSIAICFQNMRDNRSTKDHGVNILALLDPTNISKNICWIDQMRDSPIKNNSMFLCSMKNFLLFEFLVSKMKNSHRRSVIAPSKNFLLIILTRHCITNRYSIDYGKYKISKFSSKVFSFGKFVKLFGFFERLINSLKPFISIGICEMKKKDEQIIFQNNFVLGGVVGDSPHIVKDKNNGHIVILSLAFSDYFENVATDESLEDIHWFRVKFTKELAVEAMTLDVNTPIEVEGKFTQEVWQNRLNPDDKRYLGEIAADKFQVLAIKSNIIKFKRRQNEEDI